MDDRLYKEQMDRMRPIEHREGNWWEDFKVFGGFFALVAFAVVVIAMVIYAVVQ